MPAPTYTYKEIIPMLRNMDTEGCKEILKLIEEEYDDYVKHGFGDYIQIKRATQFRIGQIEFDQNNNR